MDPVKTIYVLVVHAIVVVDICVRAKILKGQKLSNGCQGIPIAR